MLKHTLYHVVVTAMKIINTVGQEIMAEMIKKGSIVHQVSAAEDNFFEEGQKEKEPEAKRTDESLRGAEKAKKI